MGGFTIDYRLMTNDLFIQILDCGGGGNGAVRRGGDELADVLHAVVAGNENAGHFGQAVFAGNGVAALIEVDELREVLVFRHLTHGNEQTRHVEHFGSVTSTPCSRCS